MSLIMFSDYQILYCLLMGVCKEFSSSSLECSINFYSVLISCNVFLRRIVAQMCFQQVNISSQNVAYILSCSLFKYLVCRIFNFLDLCSKVSTLKYMLLSFLLWANFHCSNATDTNYFTLIHAFSVQSLVYEAFYKSSNFFHG